jgi:hypothetical protein
MDRADAFADRPTKVRPALGHSSSASTPRLDGQKVQATTIVCCTTPVTLAAQQLTLLSGAQPMIWLISVLTRLVVPPSRRRVMVEKPASRFPEVPFAARSSELLSAEIAGSRRTYLILIKGSWCGADGCAAVAGNRPSSTSLFWAAPVAKAHAGTDARAKTKVKYFISFPT